LTVIPCIACPQKLRVPDDKRGTVTCPSCGATWFHPETLELSDVEFRCSFTGARFSVISSRRSPHHTFTIQSIKKIGTAMRSPEEEQPSNPQSQAVTSTSAAPLLPPSTSNVGGLLTRLLGRTPKVVATPPRPDSLKEQALDAPAIPRATYNADEYNWSGFSCPYCGASSFVSCRGGHLACDGSSSLRNGQKFHQCFCGHAGIITGTIKTVESNRLSVSETPSATTPSPPDQRSVALKPEDVGLLAARPKSGPPAK